MIFVNDSVHKIEITRNKDIRIKLLTSWEWHSEDVSYMDWNGSTTPLCTSGCHAQQMEMLQPKIPALVRPV